ncbi:MAG: efflux RND transporter periplasmic adaptor subunit, partial [Kiritimatiellales bacterium]|nr:efflux RND transporter periplasmic adaptor subunit [Kiritimatiellales bacterium]
TGTVVPNEEVMLRARVGGEVVSTAPEFLEGGLFKKGDPILEIDPADYKLALAAAASALETARFNYKLELGRQDVAKREWALLKTDDATEMERELALRIPHLAASKAALEAAEATVEKTRLDLARTDIRAPFNAVVLGANVNEGSQASQQDVLAHLAGTDAYWVIVSIPVDRLGWVAIPGSKAKLVSTSDAVREGRVIKLFGDLEEKGRMARLLVEVEDPLCLKPENKGGKPLLLGEYVRVEIDGRTLRNVYSIPRKALHGNTQIWIATPDNTLDIREVDVLWRDAQQVLIHDGLSADEQLIVSDLTAPIQGMDVNTGTTPSNKE